MVIQKMIKIKREIISIFLIVFALIILLAFKIGANTLNNEKKNQNESETFVNQCDSEGNDKSTPHISTWYTRTSLDEYFIEPSISNHSILALNPAVLNDPQTARVIVYDLETATEQELEICSLDPIIIESDIYYFQYLNDGNVEYKLYRLNKGNGDKECIFVGDDNMAPLYRLYSTDHYLVWYEADKPPKIERNDEGETVAIKCRLIVFDIASDMVVFNAETSVISPHQIPYLFNDQVALIETIGGKSAIVIENIKTGKPSISVDVNVVPLHVSFNDRYICYSQMLGAYNTVYVYDANSSNVMLQIDDYPAGFCLVDNCLFIGVRNKVKVIDIQSQKVIFDSDSDNELFEGTQRYDYIGYFSQDNNRVVFRRRDRTDWHMDICIATVTSE